MAESRLPLFRQPGRLQSEARDFASLDRSRFAIIGKGSLIQIIISITSSVLFPLTALPTNPLCLGSRRSSTNSYLKRQFMTLSSVSYLWNIRCWPMLLLTVGKCSSARSRLQDHSAFKTRANRNV